MVNNGIMNRNEARGRLALNTSDAPGMNDFTAQGALLPVGKLGQFPAGPKPPPKGWKDASAILEEALRK